MNTPESVFERVRSMLRNGDSAGLGMVLEELKSDELTVPVVRVLLSCFEDNEDLLHEMYGILHTVERSSPPVVYEATSREFVALESRAPFWAALVVGRLLNASIASGDRFDARAFIERARWHLKDDVWQLFLKVVKGLHSRGKIPAPIGNALLDA